MLLPLRLGDRGGCNDVGLTNGGAATSESSTFTILFALPRGVTDGDLEPGNEEFLVLNGGGVGGALAFVINNCLLSPGFMLLGRANALSPGDGVAEFDGGVAGSNCRFDPLYP
jgi:hypothetical protein